MNPEEQIRLNKKIELERQIAKAIFDDIEKILPSDEISDKEFEDVFARLKRKWLE